jgi:hypothetical protein
VFVVLANLYTDDVRDAIDGLSYAAPAPNCPYGLPRALNIAPVGTALEAETLIANRYLTGGFTGLTTLALPLDSVNVSAKKVVTIILAGLPTA